MEQSSMNRIIGRVLATEKNPTTMDKFFFWTRPEEKMNAFDIVKVKRSDGSFTYGVIESISHITDTANFLASFISSDFGDVNVDAPTYRIGMNYAEAKVSFNDKYNYTPVHNNEEVYLASAKEITFALGLDDVENPLVCGSLTMYEGTDDAVTLPVNLNAKFLIGPEGAHLNISGISGLAAKTSYAMFLMKAIQDQHLKGKPRDNDVAFVIFNLKGKDLMAIDRPNSFDNDVKLQKEIKRQYEDMGLRAEPFQQVRYFIPFTEPTTSKRSTWLEASDVDDYMEAGKLLKYKYLYEDDKESIEMMFANIDDPQQTMDSIISKIIDDDSPDFGGLKTWGHCLGKVSENAEKGSGKAGDISVLSWRKFKRIFSKAIKDDMFGTRTDSEAGVCRLGDELKKIKSNDVYVIDIAKLPDDKQAFVFGDTMRTLYNLKLGEHDGDEDVNIPSKLIVFIDELNKYASKDIPKTSPILRQILEVTERGRSLGIILFGAEQFRSNIVDRVTGNCSTHAYGRTNILETSSRDYGSLPQTYRNMLTRMKQGEYLIQSPIFRSLLKIHFPLPIYKQFS